MNLLSKVSLSSTMIDSYINDYILYNKDSTQEFQYKFGKVPSLKT